MTIRVGMIVALLLVATGASAQLLLFGFGSGGFGGGVPTTPCNAGQLDFSDACNTTQYMVIFR